MTDLDALYAAVMDQPNDDTPRLIYADCLEDNGAAERAAFIRVQVELARKGSLQDGSPCPCQICSELRRRERKLFDAHSREWFGDTALWLPTDNYARSSQHVAGFVVRRGFCDEWRGPMAAWVGGECGRCGGEARIGQHHDPSSDTMRGGRRCPDCVDGEVVGIGPAVVAAHPVTKITPTDREPFQFGNGSGWFGEWEYTFLTRRTDDRHTLPTALRMYANLNNPYPAGPDAAMEALSNWLIRWARVRSSAATPTPLPR